MARDVSVVFNAKDNFTTALTAMRNANAQFKTDLGGLQTKLDELNKTKFSLKVESDKAKSELKAAQKAFADLENEANRTKLEAANEAFENTQRNLKYVTSEAKNTEKAMASLADQSRRQNNQPGARNDSTLSALGKAGLTKMIGDTASQLANNAIGSMFGSAAGGLFASTLSGAASGAAIGSIIPGVGTAIGATVGGTLGLINGGAQNFQNRDDAFKSYVQNAYNNVTEEQEASRANGSALAAKRETDLISFSTLLGSKDKANSFLEQARQFSNTTPFEYDDITSLSKTLKTFGYAVDDVIPTLSKVGDAGAALGLDTPDISTVATYIGRMKSSDKASLEYLNPLNERGFSVFQWLADDMQTSIKDVYDKISKGSLSGSYVSDLILKQFQSLYGGSMKLQAQTTPGLESTLQDAQNELDVSMGAGYNKKRKEGLQAEIDYLSGESGSKMQEAYDAIGAWKADLKNQQEKYVREAQDAAMASDEYIAAKQAGDAAAMGRIVMQAKVKGMNEYNQSDGAQLALQSELDLASGIRDDAASNDAYWDAGYRKGQIFTKGLAAGMRESIAKTISGYADGKDGNFSLGGTLYDKDGNVLIQGGSGHAYGLDRVPRNGLYYLHEDERVQTAGQARSARAGGGKSISINITGNSFGGGYGPEDVARELAEKISRAVMLLAPQSQ